MLIEDPGNFATKRSEINRMTESRGVKKLSHPNGCKS
jgi:hypothetical protein